MQIKIGSFDITECWDGVFYKTLSEYPQITDWEIQNVLDFIRYEKNMDDLVKLKPRTVFFKKLKITKMMAHIALARLQS